MFKNKNKSNAENNNVTAAPSASGGSNSIVGGTNVEGTIIANSDIRIDGTLRGTLDCQGRVIIGASGHVDGTITCINAVIEGRFDGKLKVTEILNVKETAIINGDITTDKLLVQNGAVFNVTCAMGGQRIESFETVAD